MFAAINSFLTGALANDWPYVSMLLHGDGTNAAQNNTFLDGSTNNFTVTRNGNTTQGSFNPFVPTYPYDVATNGGSGYFDGSGDYLTVPDSTAFTLGTNDFTIECWINTPATVNSYVAGQADSSITSLLSSFFIYVSTAGLPQIGVYSGATLYQTISTIAISTNTWAHVAAVRNGTNIRIYVNGVQGAVTAVSTNSVNDSPSSLAVGRLGDYTTNLFAGYISNFRLVNGTCLYPSGTTFTPPTAPLTAVTNTALLLGMSNGAIYDNTMLNNLETVANAQISTSVFKYGTGALKFNGTTDYLVTSPANQAAFAFGSGNFTIECWVYISSYAGGGTYYAVMGAGTSTNTLMSFAVEINASGTAIGAFSTDGNNFTIAPNGTTGGVALNTWTHIAVVRNGTSFITYTNGVGGTASTSSATLYTTTQPLIVGSLGYDPAYKFSGYIDDLRVTKGIARYTATFTPPTAAFPNS